jgi:diguanylate cyclase
MKPAPILQDEAKRLAALRDYGLLDTATERVFDAVAKLAGKICGTPIALLSLVDEKRQWFKAVQGLDVRETPRDVAFCAHAIEARELMEVPDAAADVRFHDNPLVLRDPKIRFYAGVPLIQPDGYALGTLCVIDRKPRRLSESQRTALRQLAQTVLSLFEARKVKAESTRLGVVLDQSFNEIYVFDASTLRFLHANESACRNTGYSLDELRQRTPLALLAPAMNQLALDKLLLPLRAEKKRQVAIEIEHRRKDGSAYPVEMRLQFAPSETLPAFIAIVNDNSERLEAMRRLTESEERLRTIADNLPALIGYVDSRKHYRFVNKTYERWYGMPLAKIQGNSVLKVRGKRAYAGIRGHIESALAGNRVFFERRVALADGPRDVETTMIPHIDENRKVRGYYVLGTDVTAHRRAEKELANSQRALRALSVSLEHVREAERTRVARELTDQWAQELIAIRMTLHAVKKKLTGGEALKRVNDVLTRLGGTVAAMTKKGVELRPSSLDQLGLVAALEGLAHEFSGRSRVACQLQLSEAVARVKEPLATALFRIAEEALNNVQRHARATRAHIKLARERDGIHLEIGDDGRGITARDQRKPGCFGLFGMRERARSLGGTVNVCGKRGQGTTISVALPLHAARGKTARSPAPKTQG